MTTVQARPAQGAVPSDNRLAYMDQASFLALRARDQPQLVQWVWVYQDAIDMAALQRFHHNLGYGLLGRLIERSPLPFGRHRWVAAHLGPQIDIDDTARPRTELSSWADERAQLPIDPETGPGWRLGVASFSDGSTAISLVASHCLADGLGCGQAIAEAIHGITHDFGYPPPRSRTRPRALAADLRQTLKGVPETARALGAATRLLRNARKASAAAPQSVSNPRTDDRTGNGGGYVTVPAITVHVDQDQWDARARDLGGTSNSLFLGFAAKLGERMGRKSPDTGTVRVIITASNRTYGDSEANALSFTGIDVDPARVTTDLSVVRATTKQALRTMREEPDASLAALPLIPLIPKRAVRTLGDVVFGFLDLPVTCTNIGDVEPALLRVAGSEADYYFARGIDQKVTPAIAGQKFFLGCGRIGGRVVIPVVAYHLTGTNTKAALSELVRQTLATFDLTATID
jgi:hypothetical protein